MIQQHNTLSPHHIVQHACRAPLVCSRWHACLDDSEAEGLLEGDIGEDAAGGVGEQVDVGNVLLLVLLGVGNAAVQVVRVDQLHDLGQDLLAARRHAINVLTVSLRAHQNTCKGFACIPQNR